ncbi:MAG TPA: GDSL-type esterase/lipase family protein [Kiritimatiellia bacterium]|nr:GDSL-type esterase/lipase family protein [Kiritimatiellia bacterium]
MAVWWGLYRRILGWGLLLSAWAFFIVVGLQVWVGGVWARGFYASEPYTNLGVGIFFAIAAKLVRKGPEMTGREYGQWLGKMTLVGVSAGISFLIAEVGIRRVLEGQFGDNTLDRLRELRAQGRMPPVTSATPLAHIIEPSDDPRVIFTLLPNLDMMFGGQQLITNELGMRDEESYTVERLPDPSFRLLGLGDSGMFGWGVGQDEMYMARLRSILRARNDGVTYEVMNTGVPGYNTAQEAAVFASTWRAFRPDVVVVGWCYNDYYLPHFLLEKVDFRRRDISFVSHLLFNRDEFKRLVYGVRFTDRSDHDVRFLAPEMVEGAEFAGVRNALKDLWRMSKEDGFTLLMWGGMDSTVSAICEELGIPFFNVLERIPEEPEYKEWGVYWMHPRAEGHRVLAEAKYAWLNELGVLP